MARKTTYSEARANFARYWDHVIQDREPVIISRRGAEDVALIAADELTALEETAHLLRSPRNAVRLLTALQRALARTEPPSTLAQLRRESGIDAGA